MKFDFKEYEIQDLMCKGPMRRRYNDLEERYKGYLIPYSKLRTKSSSIMLASSSPASRCLTWAKNLSYWSIGSFNSEYAFPYSRPSIKHSNLSVNLVSDGFFFVRDITQNLRNWSYMQPTKIIMT